MARLTAHSVLVTGSTQGIGLGLVKHFLGKPNPPEWIFAACRDPEGARAEEIKNLAAKHPNLVLVPLEVTDPTSVKAAAKKVGDHLKSSGLNLLINNAGMTETHMVDSANPEDVLVVYNTNLIGLMLVTQAALNMLIRCQSLDYKEDGILFAALCPGWVKTDATSDEEWNQPTLVINPIITLFRSYRPREHPGTAKKAEAHLGGSGLNLLINNAGVMSESTLESAIAADMLAVYKINVVGPMLVTQAELTVEDSVQGILKVLSTCSEKHHGIIMDWTGRTVPW